MQTRNREVESKLVLLDSGPGEGGDGVVSSQPTAEIQQRGTIVDSASRPRPRPRPRRRRRRRRRPLFLLAVAGSLQGQETSED